MICRFVLVVYFSTLVVNTDAFFYSSRPTQDCGWLPWKYLACIRQGDEYRKLEERKKIALHGGAFCSFETESRRNRGCTVSEFITSTILSTIANRGTESAEGLDTSSVDGVSDGESVHFGRGIRRTTTPMPATTPPSRFCANTFTDPSSGVKMFGADCGDRKKRRATAMHLAKSRRKRQFGGNITTADHRDILFLLDESGSVGQENFNKELEFVKVLSEKFSKPRHIDQDATRVAVTTFADDHQHHIDLLDSIDLGHFKRGLRRINYRGGQTCLIDALKAARGEVFSSSGGSRVPNQKADGLIILVTDGCFNCHDGDLKAELQAEQKRLESHGATIVTFMINVDGDCQDSLQALQDGSSCFRGFSYPSWTKFDELIQEFRNMDGVIDRWTKKSEACP